MSEPAQAPARLLIVEDDPVYERILRAHLRHLGDRVGEIEHAGRIEDGLRLHRERAADVVLLDLTLPDSLPEQTLPRISEFVRGGATVLVLSALDDAESAQAARAAGALDFVDKGDVSADRLAAALDAAGSGAPPAGPAAPATTGAPSARQQDPESPQRLAAQLVHDAKSWLTNHSFRLSALKRTAGPGSEQLIEGLADSARAIGELLDAGRGLVIDETTPVDHERIELGPWFAQWMTERAAADDGATIQFTAPEDPLAIQACRSGLEMVLGALVDNARQAAGEGPGSVELRALPAPAGKVEVEVIDGGGPWAVEDHERLTQAFQKGERGSTAAGVGLYRARRWMERMGGTLDLVPRDDAPGSVAVRLQFESA